MGEPRVRWAVKYKSEGTVYWVGDDDRSYSEKRDRFLFQNRFLAAEHAERINTFARLVKVTIKKKPAKSLGEVACEAYNGTEWRKCGHWQENWERAAQAVKAEVERRTRGQK